MPMPIPNPRAVFGYLCARLGINPRDDRGLAAAEIAVIVVLLVGLAIYVLTGIGNAAKTNVDNIPVPSGG